MKRVWSQNVSRYLLWCGVFLLLGGALHATDEAEFLEKFALAEKREEALKELVPETEPYLYYHALHYQNEKQYDKVHSILTDWKRRFGESGRYREILYRQWLLDYDRNPGETCRMLANRLGLHFSHGRILPNRKPTYSTSLNPAVISTSRLLQRALQYHDHTVYGLTDEGLWLLRGKNLDPKRRRELLQRLRTPDWPDLPKLIVDDMRHRPTRNFGSHTVHSLLTLKQMDECLRLWPDGKNDSRFVNQYCLRLQPSADVDWQHDAKAREAFLDRLWAFVSTLNPNQNSLKAAVLYHRLVHDRNLGVYDRDRFLTYLRLPRRMGYINPTWMREVKSYAYANLGANYQASTLLAPVHDDEPLVRTYLQHFFLQDKQYTAFSALIRDTYLKPLFAKTMIAAGIETPERWASLMNPSEYQAFRDSVEVVFSPENPVFFTADAPVSLAVDVKNVETMIVKVFVIDALNYYRSTGQELSIGIDLDGLVANHEETFTYKEPSTRRVRRTLSLPMLNKRGVYVVECVGAGVRSRALIRKGELRLVERLGAAGHVFTVLNGKREPVPDAKLFVGKHEYVADKNGETVVPFSSNPGRQTVIVHDGEIAVRDEFDNKAEFYVLQAGMYVDREALLPGAEARVLVRPTLYLNSEVPISLKLLEDVTLTLRAVDRDGVESVKRVENFVVQDETDSAATFTVPERLASLQVFLTAKIKSMITQKKVDLAANDAFSLNGIDRFDHMQDVFLSRSADAFRLRVLGKTGEPLPDRVVQVWVKHRLFTDQIHQTLQTDKNGEINLGTLDEIIWVRAQEPAGISREWNIPANRCRLPQTLNALANRVIALPLMYAAKPDADSLALFEKRGNGYVKDWFSALSIDRGYLQIRGLPAGDYDLFLKREHKTVRIAVTNGPVRGGFLVGDARMLEVADMRPLQISSVENDAQNVRIRLEMAGKGTRVHLVATRFMPAYDLFDHMFAAMPEPALFSIQKADSLYESGRAVSDEYRYVLDRKYAEKFAGAMLARPELLLNPWALTESATGHEEGKGGAEFSRRRSRSGRGGERKKMEHARRNGHETGNSPNLDFLPVGAVVLENLLPNEKGEVVVPLKTLAGNPHLHVVAIGPRDTVYRQTTLAETPLAPADLRLANGLDTAKHYVEARAMTALQKDETAPLGSRGAKLELYDSLPAAYRLFATLSNNATWAQFAFLLDWPNKTTEQKRDLYMRHACHELHFFLYQKDRAFFDAEVKPYLANKKDKTFLDHWLLGETLEMYLENWRFRQLNTMEKILLARRLQQSAPSIRRAVEEAHDLIPPNPDRDAHLFFTALQSGALEGDKGGIPGLSDIPVAGRLGEEFSGRIRGGAERSSKRVFTNGLASAPSSAPAAPAVTSVPRQMYKARAEKAKKADKLSEALMDSIEAEEAADEDYEGDDDDDYDAPAEIDGKDLNMAGFASQDVGLDLPLDLRERDLKRREQGIRQFYRKLEPTREYAENNYYNLPIEQQDASLVKVNRFWRAYAAHTGATPFVHRHLAECANSFTEMMFALSVLDLPFAAPKHATVKDNGAYVLRVGGPLVLVRKEIREGVVPQDNQSPILVNQNVFAVHDRYRHEGNQRFEKYVTGEFLIHTAYGCQIVLTNPTAGRQRLTLLLELPRGAMPLANAHVRRGIEVELQPYGTRTLEYHFYFPRPGAFAHYPVQVAKDETVVAFAAPRTYNVLAEPSTVDTTSWEYISQNGSLDEVLAYMDTHNLGRLNLDKIAWHMKNRASYNKILTHLRGRHRYHATLWGYAIHHRDTPAIREFLTQQDDFVRHCGLALTSTILTIDPVLRKTYQHLEYKPLVNARQHPFGGKRRILNDRLRSQYGRLMHVLSYHARFNDDAYLAVTYYLLLQDRIAEALPFFKKVNPNALATRLQYDYFAVYLHLVQEQPALARKVADSYRDYPVERWRNLFTEALSQLDEIEGKTATPVDTEDRQQQQSALAASEPEVQFRVEKKTILIDYQNVKDVTIRYYPMDVELLFSMNPFVQDQSDRFSYIRPNTTETVALPAGKRAFEHPLPAQYHSANVLVEMRTGALQRTQVYFANALAVQVIENYGQVRVTHRDSAKPLAKTYIKVYARMRGGETRFYKDGYTDLRGRFDYASLSTLSDLDAVERFSILILHEQHGAMIREAAPPKQ